MIDQQEKHNSTENNKITLPELLGRRYFTIGEASRLCQLKPSVLRYWESEFSQIKPVKRRGNRRYYRQEDLQIILTIRELLHLQGYTIQGAKQQLNSNHSFSSAEIVSDLQEILSILEA